MKTGVTGIKLLGFLQLFGLVNAEDGLLDLSVILTRMSMGVGVRGLEAETETRGVVVGVVVGSPPSHKLELMWYIVEGEVCWW